MKSPLPEDAKTREALAEKQWELAELGRLAELPRSAFWPAIEKVLTRLQNRSLEVALHEMTDHDRTQFERGRLSLIRDFVEFLETDAARLYDERQRKAESERERGPGERPTK